MTRIIKYGLCIFISALLTCSVIFLPYAYYSGNDKKSTGNYVTENFSLDSGSDSVTTDEVIELLSSDEALWVKSSEPLNNIAALYYIQSAVLNMNNSFQKNDYVLNALSVLNKNLTELSPQMVENVTVNGKIGEKAVSVSLLYAQYNKISYEDTNSSLLKYAVLIDRKTKKVYELCLDTDSPLFESDFYIEQGLYDSKIDDLYKQTIGELKDYWDTESEDFSLTTNDYEFSFNIMPMQISYTQYSFNRYSSAEININAVTEE